MLNKRVLLVAALAAAMVAGCADKPKKPTAKEQLTQNWKDARAAVQYTLAKQQYDGGNFGEARKSIDQALSLSPRMAPALILSAKIHIEHGDLQPAHRQLTEALVQDPSNAEADYLLGVVLQRWQKPQEALACYEAARAKQPEELAYLLAAAETLVTLDRVDEALGILQPRVVFFENSAAIRDAVGQLLFQKGRYGESIAMLRQASVLSPNNRSIREHLALALFHGGEHREAIEVLVELTSEEPYASRSDLLLALGECYMNVSRPREARAVFDRATQLEPGSAAVWMRLGKAALELSDLRRAELSLRKALSLEGSNAEAHLMMGYLRLQQDRFAEALSSFNKAAALDRTDTVALCMIGYVLEKMDRPAQAMNYYAQALKLKPNDELASRLMAGVDLHE